MTYLEAVRSLAIEHADAIRADLELARHRLRQEKAHVAKLERQIVSLEGLLATADTVAHDPEHESSLTLHAAMVRVLQDHPLKKMRPADLLFEIGRRNLYRMRDGRQPELQQIHARVGNYQHLFVREGTFIKLRATVS